jgi:hypothetical protein
LFYFYYNYPGGNPPEPGGSGFRYPKFDLGNFALEQHKK